jgi:hypothetical protein
MPYGHTFKVFPTRMDVGCCPEVLSSQSVSCVLTELSHALLVSGGIVFLEIHIPKS